MLLHICSNIMKISLTVQSFRTDTIFILTIPKQNNSEKNGGLWFLFCAYCPMVLVLCILSDDAFVPSFMKISTDHFKVIQGV